jgi:aromatic ring hydroxylase
LAGIYDLQHDPSYLEMLTTLSPTSGQRVSLAYLLPETGEDLARRRQMIEFLAGRCGGVAARLPDYVNIILVGLYDVRGLLGQEDPAFAENAVQYLDYCRENDLHVTHAFGDPSRDQSRPVSESERLHIVEKRPDGIVIRGAKTVATSAPFADEFFGATLQPVVGDEAFWFAVPMNAAGIHMVCRQPLAPPNPEDHPLSSYWDEMDAQVIFDDVFVPRDRVFYLKQVTAENQMSCRLLLIETLVWASWHILIRLAVKAEALAGICAAITDYLGTAKQPHIQLALSDAIAYMETLRALVIAAEVNARTSHSGLLAPNSAQITVGRIFGIDGHPRILQIIREVCGSGILMAPSEADMSNPVVGPHIQRNFVGSDERATERFQMLKLAWEYAADSFGSRQLLFEMFNAGGSVTFAKMGLAGAYDKAPLVRLAKDLAGIPGDQ